MNPFKFLISPLRGGSVHARVIFVSPYFQIQIRSGRFSPWQTLRDHDPTKLISVLEDVTDHYARNGIKSATLAREYFPVKNFTSMQEADNHIASIMGMTP